MILALASVGLGVKAAPDTLYLSKNECLEIALTKNATVKVADMEITLADYSKKESLAALFPTADFSANYQRAIELQTVSMNMNGQRQSFKMGSDNTWSIGFSASVPLIAPQLWQALKLSDTQIMINRESARASRLDLINSVNQAYYALLLAKASKEVIQQNYDVAIYNADIYQKKFEQGTASEYDVLRSSVQVTNVEPELLQADIAIRQASLQLKVLLNLPVEVVVNTRDAIQNYQQEMYGYNADSYNLESNTSMRSLALQTKLASENLKLKKFAWLPTLGASFNYNWNALSNGSAVAHQQFNPYSTLALSLSLPIISGSNYFGVKQAEVQVKEMALQKETLESNLNMQVDLALDNINREAAQITSSRKGVDQARKAHEIMQKSFEIGAATYLDLRDSEVADTSAQLTYYQSIYNYLVSVSQLDYLLGRDVDAQTIK